MITGSQEYEQFLVSLATPDKVPSTALTLRIPSSENVYQIDLNTRQVQAPPFIGVSGDHRAEYVFFEMDRYFDTVDLANTIGLVVFKNAHNEEYYQLIPYYDITSEKGKIFFPWSIQAPATTYVGIVNFSFKFFMIDAKTSTLIYELNTAVAKTKVLEGWANSTTGAEHTYHIVDSQSLIIDEPTVNILNKLLTVEEKMRVYWIDVDEEQQQNILNNHNTDLLNDAIQEP